MVRLIMGTVLVFLLNAVAHAASDDAVTILLLGDSTVLCKNAEKGISYADWIETVLSGEIKKEVQVINGGAEGATVADGKTMLRKYKKNEIDAVSVRFGFSDARTLSPKDHLAHYEAFIKDVRKQFPESRLILETSLPVGNTFSGYDTEKFSSAEEFGSYLEQQFVASVRSLAKKSKLTLVDQYELISMVMGDSKEKETLISPDGIHLTARGNLLAAQNTVGAIFDATGMRSVRVDRFGLYVTPEALGIVKQATEKTSSPDLAPFLELSEKHVFPLLEKQLKDPSPEVRKDALELLERHHLFSDRFLSLICGMLEDPDRYVRDRASMWIRNVAKRNAFPALLELLVQDAGSARGNGYLLSLLMQYRKSIDFSNEHYDRFLALLDADSNVSNAFQLLFSTKEGAVRFLDALKRYPEAKAVATLKNGWAYIRENEDFQEFLWKQIKDTEKPYLAGVCLEQVISHNFKHQDIPVEILKYAFVEKQGDLQRSAFKYLLWRGEKSVPVFIACLELKEKRISDAASLALLDLALTTVDEDKTGFRALSAARDYLSHNGNSDFLFALAEVLLQSRNKVLPAGTTQFSGSLYRSIKRNYPVSYYQRLREAIPFLEKMKQKGTENEQFIAQKILVRLWSLAQNSPGIGRASSRYGRTSSRFSRTVPPRRWGRSLTNIAGVYQKEAEQSLKEGNLEQCIVNCRRVLAADPRASTYNSLAWRLVWAPDPTEEHYKQAEKLARKAIEKGGRTAQSLDTLAASLAGRGRFKQALELQLEALQKLNKTGTYASRALLYLRRLAPK